MVFQAAYWLPAFHEEERLTRGCALWHVRELVALRRTEAREQDSWAQVVPPTIQLPDSICACALQWGLKRQHGEQIYQWLEVTLFFWDGGEWELEGWGVDCGILWSWGPQKQMGQRQSVIRWRAQRSRAICMMGMKQPGGFNWVGVRGHRQPYCAAFYSPGKSMILERSWWKAAKYYKILSFKFTSSAKLLFPSLQ